MLPPPAQGPADDRSKSFFKVLDLLPKLRMPPKYLLIENVVGFESSGTRDVLQAAMREQGYVTQEFILTPLQYGVPYSRPRWGAGWEYALTGKVHLRVCRYSN